MKVLIIGKIWPEPSSSAAGTRTIDLIRGLATAGWDIHFASSAQISEFSAPLSEQFDVTTHSIQLNSSCFDEWIQELSPEIVIFDRYMTEEQFGWRVSSQLPNALRVIDTSDLHFLRHARQQSIKQETETELYNEIALREMAAIYRSDLSLIISEYEMQVLQNEFAVPQTSLAYWPFALPAPSTDIPSFESRKNFVMIGSFLHEPNWDAVRFFHDEIWPQIRTQLPETEVHIYGSYPPPKAYQLDNSERGFRIIGRATNAIETLAKYRINLAPLRFGAGLKGKLADAFLAGTPSVASPIAVEGMAGGLEWGSNVSINPSQFAQTAVDLYRDKNAWQHAQQCGFEIAKSRFDRSEWLPKLPQLLEDAYRNSKERRSKNFVGQMLNHHHHRSTEFMSRWIEEKNKLR